MIALSKADPVTNPKSRSSLRYNRIDSARSSSVPKASAVAAKNAAPKSA
jgi:hypothetical protein